MANEAFHTLNNAVIEFAIEYRDSDPLVATMQRTITELSRQAVDIASDLSKRLLAIEMAMDVLRVLLGYIEQEYPKEYRALPPAPGFTCV